jgi:hypothetical protein
VAARDVLDAGETGLLGVIDIIDVCRALINAGEG